MKEKNNFDIILMGAQQKYWVAFYYFTFVLQFHL